MPVATSEFLLKEVRFLLPDLYYNQGIFCSQFHNTFLTVNLKWHNMSNGLGF